MATQAAPATGRTKGRATKERIVDAALETLKREGFSGTSARAIASTGGFNQALIFYHFGGVHELLLAALDRTSEERMARYREAVDACGDLADLARVAREVYAEDLERGHIQVLAEMVAGASSVPELGSEIVARLEPWIDFVEETASRFVDRSFVGALVEPRDLAYSLVALYLGVELLVHLEGDHARADRMFAMGQQLASTFGALIPLSPAQAPRKGARPAKRGDAP